jgi:hypothetical protein
MTAPTCSEGRRNFSLLAFCCSAFLLLVVLELVELVELVDVVVVVVLVVVVLLVGVVEEVGSTPSSFVVVASSAKLSLENDSFLSLDRLRERDDIW